MRARSTAMGDYPVQVPHFYAAPPPGSHTKDRGRCCRCGKPAKAKVHLNPNGDARYPKSESRAEIVRRARKARRG